MIQFGPFILHSNEGRNWKHYSNFFANEQNTNEYNIFQNFPET